MIINIPSQSTIKEYKYLKKSQQEVNINQTSNKLDEYIYDKTHKFNNLKAFGGLVAINLLFSILLFKSKNKVSMREPLFMLLISNFFIGGNILDDEKNKKYTLNNKDEKLRLYNRNGINAIV